MDPGAELDRDVAAFGLQHRALRLRPIAILCAVLGFIGFFVTFGMGRPEITAIAALVACLLLVVAGLAIGLSRTPLMTNGLIALFSATQGPDADSTSSVRLMFAILEGISWASTGLAVGWFGVNTALFGM